MDWLCWRDARLVVADTFWRRLAGMMGWGTVRGRGRRRSVVMAFPACTSVHTCFMRRRLDIAFLDEHGRVLRLARSVGPWRVLRCKDAVAVLERFSTS